MPHVEEALLATNRPATSGGKQCSFYVSNFHLRCKQWHTDLPFPTLQIRNFVSERRRHRPRQPHPRDSRFSFRPQIWSSTTALATRRRNPPAVPRRQGGCNIRRRGGQKRYTLDANCAYYFGRSPDGRVDLQKIGLGEDGTAAEGRKLPESASRAPKLSIPVKILVDEEEPGRPGIWEQRLKRRVEAASAIFEKSFHVGFHVAAIGTWKSDNAITDFFDSLAEFEKKVDPSPGKIAIGFTSQWSMARGRIHMAGTRGPLHAHILVREGNPQINEAERLEFLVHELGHYLGAAHSPEPQSAMRPVLGDKRAGRSDFHINFDPVNALAIGMITEEMRRSNISKVSQLNYVTRRRLEQIYVELTRAMPEDPAGFQYAGLMRTNETPLALSTRQVLQQIVRAAVENRALPVTAIEGSKQPARREGDALTAYYVREAARAASSQPGELAAQAFLLGVAIGLDSSVVPPSIPGVAGLLRTVESPSERQIRLAVLGNPTMRGRLDLTQHFFSSAFLTAAGGGEPNAGAAPGCGLSKAQRPSGLSFKVIAADRAGSRFGRSLVDKRFTLQLLATSFEVASYMPEVDSLPDGISAKDLNSQYGAKTDPRFLKQLREIDQRVSASSRLSNRGIGLRPLVQAARSASSKSSRGAKGVHCPPRPPRRWPVKCGRCSPSLPSTIFWSASTPTAASSTRWN